jgi:hypothetical protein
MQRRSADGALIFVTIAEAGSVAAAARDAQPTAWLAGGTIVDGTSQAVRW